MIKLDRSIVAGVSADPVLRTLVAVPGGLRPGLALRPARVP
ncbi:MAG TPA: hypothetical protein VIM19_11845 [Actinomycetes bacterium]